MSTLGTRRLLEILGSWEDREGPRYQRLYRALSDAIRQSDLPAGTKLPAERRLSEVLAVSRATVTQAYEMLRSEGWVQSRQGSGTWVGARPEGPLPRVTAGPRPLSSGTFFGRLVDSSPHPPINLSTAALSDFQAALRVQGESLVRAEDLLDAPGHGYAPLGYSRLREAVAGLYRDQGAATRPEEILITSGAQQAISLLAGHFVQPGDCVALETPTYAGAIDAFSRAGARLVTIPVGLGGVRVEQLARVLQADRPKLIYLMPTYQNPTGEVMPEAARREVVALARRFETPVVEDNTLADISLAGPPPALLANHAAGAPVISVGSMSKLYWAGLRVGWVRAEESLITRLGRHKVAADLGSSLLSQALGCTLLAHRAQICRMRSEQLTPRLDLLEELLRQRIPDWSWRRPEGGLSLWVRIPTDDAGAYAEQALRHGVAVVPGETLSPDGAHQDYLRLNYVVEQAQLDVAVERLATAWQAHRRAGGAQGTEVAVKV